MQSEKLGFLLSRAAHTHWRVSGARFQKRGITPGQPKILGFLARHDGCIQRELAEHCRFQAASISGVLSSMEREGLIERRQDSADRRVLRVHLTEKGREVEAFCHHVLDDLDEAALAGFTEQERIQAISLIRRIGDNLDAQVDESVPAEPPHRP